MNYTKLQVLGDQENLNELSYLVNRPHVWQKVPLKRRALNTYPVWSYTIDFSEGMIVASNLLSPSQKHNKPNTYNPEKVCQGLLNRGFAGSLEFILSYCDGGQVIMSQGNYINRFCKLNYPMLPAILGNHNIYVRGNAHEEFNRVLSNHVMDFVGGTLPVFNRLIPLLK